jgi:hypothetical protein
MSIISYSLSYIRDLSCEIQLTFKAHLDDNGYGPISIFQLLTIIYLNLHIIFFIY